MKKVLRVLRNLLVTIGFVAAVMVIMAFTTAPFWMWYGLSTKKAGIHRPPGYIIVMGGGGMPSQSALMRCWYASMAAVQFPKARVIIALPGDARDSLSSLNQMKKELQFRGVAPNRILLEDSGTNTRAEALNILKIISNIEYQTSNSEVLRHASRVTRHNLPVTRHASLLIVSSPEHIFRSVLTFRKAGFLKVDGLPAFEKTIEADLGFNAKKLGSRAWVPDVGNSLTIRYQFWMQLQYEFLVLREYMALAYYKLQGWI